MPGSVTPTALSRHRWSAGWMQTPQEGACAGSAHGGPAGVSEFHHRDSRSSVRTAVLLAALMFFQTYALISAVILSTDAMVGHASFPSALHLAFHCSMFITAPCLTF